MKISNIENKISIIIPVYNEEDNIDIISKKYIIYL